MLSQIIKILKYFFSQTYTTVCRHLSCFGFKTVENPFPSFSPGPPRASCRRRRHRRTRGKPRPTPLRCPKLAQGGRRRGTGGRPYGRAGCKCGRRSSQSGLEKRVVKFQQQVLIMRTARLLKLFLKVPKKSEIKNSSLPLAVQQQQ